MFVNFGKVARKELGMQAQYASRFVDGRHGEPNLGDGLRFKGLPKDYHSLMIEENDISEFVSRVKYNQK